MIFMTTPSQRGRSGRLFGFEGGLFGARADGGVDGHLVRAGHREHVRRIIDGGYWRAIGIAQAGFRHGKDQWSLARQQEFDLLTELIHSQGRVLTREVLLGKLWGYDFFGDERIIDTHIKNLRKKLGTVDYIETIRGVGYRIDKEDKE